jgi:hypothetical protein
LHTCNRIFRIDRLKFRMSNVWNAIKETDPPKYNVLLVISQGLFHPLRTLKPHQFYLSCVIIKGGYKAVFSPFAFFVNINERTCKLHVFYVRMYVADLRYLCAVEITIRIMMQQILKRAYLKLLSQQFPTLWTNTFQVLYRCI